MKATTFGGDEEKQTLKAMAAPVGLSNQKERLATYSTGPWCTRRRALLAICIALGLSAVVVMVFLSKWQEDDINVPIEDDSIPDVEGTLESDVLPEMESDVLPEEVPEGQSYGPKEECDPKAPRPPKGSKDYAVLAADCGLGYDYENSAGKTEPWTVVLYGRTWSIGKTLKYSGCPVGPGACPLSPQCTIIKTEHDLAVARKGDVVVIFQNDSKLIDQLVDHPAQKKQYRVLYYREAYWTYPSKSIQKKFDFQMGVHWQSAVWNPDFAYPPAILFGGLDGYGFNKVPSSLPFLSAAERSHFAISIMSHCHAESKRDHYIERMIDVMGKNRVHQYGRCGDRTLPPPPIKNAARLISKYKFYLSFENMIQDGYMTEKLLRILAMPLVPVYYGHWNVPNMTITPSFIKASDFTRPENLAQYLLHLGDHPDEYEAFHAWRKDKDSIHPQFLERLAMKLPGYFEMDAIRQFELNKTERHRSPRTAVCCRLCDRNHVEWAANQPRTIHEAPLTTPMILRNYFGTK